MVNLSLDLPQQDPTWYSMLSNNLTQEQQKALQGILTMAEQKKEQKRSDAIEKSGGKFSEDLKFIELLINNLYFLKGFQFNSQAIPTSFNFSSPN